MERAFKLTKFRNFGLNKPERLVINHSLEKGKIGELIILIGPNNSGKSNVLDALTSFSNEKLADRDKTFLSNKDEDKLPEISFTVKDNDDVYGKIVSLKGSRYFMDLTSTAFYSDEEIKTAKTQIAELYDKTSGLFTNAAQNTNLTFLEKIKEEVKKIKNDKELIKFIKEIDESNIIKSYKDDQAQVRRGYSSRISHEIRTLVANLFGIDAYKKYLERENSDVNKVFKDKYGINLIPNIIVYNEPKIEENQLYCDYTKIKSNPFYSVLFSDEEIEQINNAYTLYRSHRNPEILEDLKESFSAKIEKINKRFNQMYFAEKNKYKFSLYFVANEVQLGIKRGSKPIFLNYQSAGFKWFFNFYFSFINNNEFEPGDIIIMDEPATHLHAQGIVELRKFIKELATRNDITFVIATHLIQFVNVDNYDELRVISIDDNIAHIANEFIAVDYDDPDTLKPIKDALTIQQHVLYDYDTTVMFVEGITDYNYLTMFRNLFDIPNICFVPIKGLGKKGDHERVIKTLAKIGRNPVLLVDGDGAGREVQKYVQDNNIDLEILCVTDAVPGCKEIEDLFSEQDRIKHKVDSKDSFYSSLLKKTATLDDFGKTTKDNFKALLKNITA